jgi:hypothetical protein
MLCCLAANYSSFQINKPHPNLPSPQSPHSILWFTQLEIAVRRGRRNRKTRYRQARFLNRIHPDGWLGPSLGHRVETVLTWVNRLCKFAPIGSIAQELVRFDLQQMQNPEISGIEYQ